MKRPATWPCGRPWQSGTGSVGRPLAAEGSSVGNRCYARHADYACESRRKKRDDFARILNNFNARTVKKLEPSSARSSTGACSRRRWKGEVERNDRKRSQSRDATRKKCSAHWEAEVLTRIAPLREPTQTFCVDGDEEDGNGGVRKQTGAETYLCHDQDVQRISREICRRPCWDDAFTLPLESLPGRMTP